MKFTCNLMIPRGSRHVNPRGRAVSAIVPGPERIDRGTWHLWSIVIFINIFMATTVHIPDPLLKSVDRRAAGVAVPQPVLAEIAFGIERLRSKGRAAVQARFLIAAELPRGEWTDGVSWCSAASKRPWSALERGLRILTPPLRRIPSLSRRRSSRQTSAT